MRAGKAVFGWVFAAAASALGTGPVAAQSLNHGYEAMDRGDFYAAFSAMRRLEQAGDPNAARLLQEVFLAPGSNAAPAPPPPAAAPAPQATAPATRGEDRRAPRLATAPRPVAPTRSPRPPERVTLAAQRSAAPAPAPAPPPQPLPLPLPVLEGRITPLPLPLRDEDFHPVDTKLAGIGHLLFFDPVLSGNRDTSCATCHHPRLGSGDSVSLGLGTGATGLGEARAPSGPQAAARRIPRNAPGLWNLGATAVHTLFHDGRLEGNAEAPERTLSPQGPLDYMALHSLLAAQVLFPVLAPEEMAGQPGDNPIADAVDAQHIHGDDGAWGMLAARIDAIPGYRAAFSDWRGEDRAVRIDEIANAIAAFIAEEFRADQTPFDAYLREEAALSSQAGEGMRLFYGRANCASCHSGPLLSDQRFHAMGQPPVGPGKTAHADGYTRDIGRGGVTFDPADDFAFRTPMLRNVMATGPWGHAGAFSDMRAFLRHHLDPVAGLAAYQPQAVLPGLPGAGDDYAALDNPVLMADITAAAARAMAHRPTVVLLEDEIDLLLAFLETLTDTAALEGRRGVPEALPSGLPVPR